MRKTKFYILFMSLILNVCCKNEPKEKVDELVNIDLMKTTELITQILNDEKNNYLSSTCISEKPWAVLFPMVSDFDSYVKEHVNIVDSIHLSIQMELFNNFKLTKTLVSDKKIITNSDFEELKEQSKQGNFGFWEWLNENCINGYCSISKPIFNETFDLAYVQIGTVCGDLCGGGEERIYEYKEDKWTEKEHLGSWVN